MSSKKGITMLFTVILIVLLIAGCSTKKDVSTNDNETGEGSKDGGTLVIVRLSDADNLDHQFSSTINAVSVTHRKVYEGLVGRDKNSEIQPLLAKEWKQLDDTTWEFKLREDVKFHDGTPFNADAVKATFDRLLDPNVGSPRAVVLKMVNEIKVVDEHTVQFILSQPFAPLLSILANHEGGIINPTMIEKYGKKSIQEPSGTGPFVFEKWTPGQEIVLNKNEDYWGEKPKLDKVVFKVVPEETTRISMVETGEAHIAEPLSVAMLDTVEASQNSEVYRSEAFGTEFVAFNVQKAPFNDSRVRKAISHAIESDSIIEGVFNNAGSKANSLLGSKVFGYHKGLKASEYNLNEAKKLLAEAGYPQGFEATLKTMDNKERVNLAEVLQSQLKGIGINLTIQVLEYGTFIEQINTGDTEMFINSWRNATGDADYNQYNLLHSSSHGPHGNTFFYSNKEVDSLIEAARAEKDENKRIELYAKAQEIELDEAVYIPVRVIENLAAVSKKVEGFDISPSGYLEINDISIK
ncbi:glutathione ABC transporter substrate-binding protein [Bacillus sp. DTU_2020_1000418_1_SI_GHA_SEK_038]|uniref:glutathione ABC transporter substrate-binding protein n=1 Tax=Bacillus sp. DTU_2020_1000418_1_SI_GHA_SEK_038 TaxID=3077585 RepID=UPI0028E63A34|nr:glutathione ABC transporter substrate-binding protein [Bacillus sp. DTU_2020_1000418_1_SI_GHA_SEK_038]WNS76242.1 glutathione ABC transporter substrate-binding protein [Bacillus sp. DTU_2020_1000418_1_SI_GHA_SEK_038]